jgi:hypothetical protein
MPLPLDRLADSVARWLFDWLSRRAGPDASEWVDALAAESTCMESGWHRFRWALGGVPLLWTINWSCQMRKHPEIVALLLLVLLTTLAAARGVRDMDGFGLFMLGTGVAVGVTVGLVVRLFQLAVERIRGRHFSRTVGWAATCAWALGFALGAFAAAGVVSIGFVVLPFAVIACAVAAWRCRALPEGAIGAGLGTGIVLFVIGLMNPTLPPCVAIGVRNGEPVYPGNCGGVNGTSWVLVAAALVVAAVAGQIVMERRNVHGIRATSLPM